MAMYGTSWDNMGLYGRQRETLVISRSCAVFAMPNKSLKLSVSERTQAEHSGLLDLSCLGLRTELHPGSGLRQRLIGGKASDGL